MDKEALKAQLKAQNTPQKVGVPVNDPRNQGLRRIYFFQRKGDGYIFPLDNELQASHLVRRKDFTEKFSYLGWSNGEKLAQFERGNNVVVEYQNEEALTDSSQKEVDSYRVAYEKLIEEELEAAIDNPDKSYPRDFRKRDLHGNLLNNAVLSTIMGI